MSRPQPSRKRSGTKGFSPPAPPSVSPPVGDATTITLAILLFAVVAWVFSPAGDNQFISYDDPGYFTANLYVQQGLSWAGLKWAFTSLTTCSNWHPLTWLSHMLDCQLYGLTPRGPHLTNVLLHAANAALLFLVLRRMTGAVWRCAFVAAVFGLHPLRVESVAWLAERKDVLSVCFGLLALWFYTRIRPPAAAPAARPAAAPDYWLALLFFALSLLSKPTLVTLPVLLLLLDAWPFQRFTAAGSPTGLRQRLLRLGMEKLPFLALSAGSSVMTMIAQSRGGAVSSLENISVAGRCANALVSCERYLRKMFWPADLAIFYPHPVHWPAWRVILAALMLVTVTVAAVRVARRRPWLAVGWGWFLIALVPVIGLVQVGSQSIADRYTYIPGIGILLAVTWLVADGLGRLRHRFAIGLSLGLGVLLACTVQTRRQLGCWRDSETLFRHATEVTADNFVALNNLGAALMTANRFAEALRDCQAAIQLRPDYAEAYDGLGSVLLCQGRVDEAIAQFRTAVTLNPRAPGPHSNLGAALGIKGQYAAAIEQLQTALELDAANAGARRNLTKALELQSNAKASPASPAPAPPGETVR